MSGEPILAYSTPHAQFTSKLWLLPSTVNFWISMSPNLALSQHILPQMLDATW
jgi:hypothetical protein